MNRSIWILIISGHHFQSNYCKIASFATYFLDNWSWKDHPQPMQKQNILSIILLSLVNSNFIRKKKHRLMLETWQHFLDEINFIYLYVKIYWFSKLTHWVLSYTNWSHIWSVSHRKWLAHARIRWSTHLKQILKFSRIYIIKFILRKRLNVA